MGFEIWAPGISIAGLRKEGREWQAGLAEVAGAGRWQIGPAGVEKGKKYLSVIYTAPMSISVSLFPKDSISSSQDLLNFSISIFFLDGKLQEF